MSNILSEISNIILSIPRLSKQLLAVTSDSILCILCVWFAFALRLEEFIPLKDFDFNPALISITIAIPVFWLLGLYHSIFRYFGLSTIYTILISSFIYGFLYFLIIGIYTIQGVPRSIGIIQPILLFLSIISSRLGAKYLLNLNHSVSHSPAKQNILIYGSGNAGRQLVLALENSPEFKVVGLLDDDDRLHKKSILGLTVYASAKLQNLIQAKDIRYVFLALPRINRKRRNQIIENLNQYKLKVKTLPSISEIVEGRIDISDIKDLNIDDLLNRDEVQPDKKLLYKNIDSKTILVTGAGGSIGSELCRQIIKLNPRKLLLVELNEFALYKIYEELTSLNRNLKIISLLVNAQDQFKLEKIFENFKVNTVYHAAAYKHVPLVEENICEGVKNNVFSTLAVSKASINKKVSNLVLISSDKAVRPTNIMGASKRLSELCMQGIYNHTRDISTNFSIVRFGNVLESSGSVIPKFKKQIKEGGPVTLTHEDVTRYFMTTTEAAQLVIQAGAMGKDSEVFILDMGESVKIKDLIYKMIKLSGFSVKDDDNPSGEIELKIVGLRPGEKLYEELLTGTNPQKTRHPKILKTSEPYILFDKLEIDLNNLESLIKSNEVKDVKSLLEKLLDLYVSNSEIVDHIYNGELSKNKFKENLLSSKNKDGKIIKIK